MATASDDEAQNEYTTPNSILFQDFKKDFVRITINIPGMQVKRQLNLSKTPKNGRLYNVEYKKKKCVVFLCPKRGHLPRKIVQVCYKGTFQRTNRGREELL